MLRYSKAFGILSPTCFPVWVTFGDLLGIPLVVFSHLPIPLCPDQQLSLTLSLFPTQQATASAHF